MSSLSPGTTPIWAKTVEPKLRDRLERNGRVDVCVVGAGISGLTTAYLLAREGRSVAVLEDGRIASGETGRTTAHFSNALDDRYVRLEALHGETGARLAAESHTQAIDRAESIAAEEAIACDARRVDGYLFMPPGESTQLLDRELEAARRAGLDLSRVERAPLPAFDTGPALRFPRQLELNPLRYVAGLAAAIERRGGRIHERTHVTGIHGGRTVRIETERGPGLEAGAVVVATNSPITDWVAMHTKQAPYRTYALAARVARGAVERALWWDTADPYHYVRLAHVEGEGDGEDDVLVAGGEDHKTGHADDAEERWRRIEEWTRERFPIGAVVARWSGQVLEPIDGLAFIGKDPESKENVYVATGDSGNGMTHGTIAGMLLSDLVAGRENPWARLYDPRRKTPRAIADFTRENLQVLLDYGDWLTRGEVPSSEDIPRGEGAVVRRGLRKVAIYRDPDGGVHERSAVCTHLGCIVRWNSAEKSWDCPCHGSRFAAKTGEVLNGPANTPLSPLEPE